MSDHVQGKLPVLAPTLRYVSHSLVLLVQTIANFGSNAVSVAHAEHIALQYYWWFMVLTAFSSTLLTTMVIDAFNEDLAFGSEFRSVLGQISETIPSTISVTWLNWIYDHSPSELLVANQFVHLHGSWMEVLRQNDDGRRSRWPNSVSYLRR